jgi:hypothetical protein
MCFLWFTPPPPAEDPQAKQGDDEQFQQGVP